MGEFAIEVSKTNISFNGVQVLFDVDFYVKAGEVHALAGTNGAGKTTLVKIINGVYKQDSGTISIRGKPVNYVNPEGARESGIGMVFQDLSLIPTMTVAENVFLRTNPYRTGFLIDDRKNAQKTMELLQLIGVDTEIRPRDIVGDLSIGKQQIVEIAKALAGNPGILIFDEPTASLSNTEIERLFAVIEVLKSKGISVIYITHYLRDIFKICDSLTLIRDGRIVLRRDTDKIDIAELVSLMTESESKPASWDRKRRLRQGTPILEIKNLSSKGIDNVSLSVYPGEIVGIVGLLGSGRTEFFRALFGIDKLSGGDILIDGEKIMIGSPADAISNGISLIPENRRVQGLILDFPVRENMVLSIFNRLARYFMINDKKTTEVADRYIKALDIKTSGPMQIVNYLSGGNQQKVVVAKSLAGNSRVLLLDDPTFGVDIHAKHEIMKIIHDYARQGNGVIMVSSEFNEIANFCDCIYIMKRGRITDFVPERTSEDELLLKAQ